MIKQKGFGQRVNYLLARLNDRQISHYLTSSNV